MKEKIKWKMKKNKEMGREGSKQIEFGGISGPIRKKKKRKKREEERGKRRKRSRERKKKGKGVFRFSLRFMEIGLLVFVGARDKVHLRDESYAWVPKYRSFVKLKEVGNFPN